MATLIHALSNIFRQQTAPSRTPWRADPNPGVFRPMMLSALQESTELVLNVVSRTLLGVLVVVVVAVSLPFAPGIGFYSALSASLALVYIASLTDVRRVRDAIYLVTVAVFVVTVLAFNPLHPVWVGLTLFTHVFMSFSTGLSRTSGSLNELNLWPVLFGIELSVLLFFIDQILV